MTDQGSRATSAFRATVVTVATALALVLLLGATTATAATRSDPPADTRTGLLAAPAHDPDDVRETVRDVLDRREYQPARRSLLQRLRETARTWIAEQLVRLLSGTRGSAFAWSVVVLGLAGGGLLLWRVIRRTSRDPGQAAEVTVAPTDRRPEEWWADAAAAQGAGDLEGAVRAAYHAVIASLHADGLLDGSDGSTIGEHRRELAATAPTLARRFDPVALRVEDVLYGPATATATDVEELRRLAPVRAGSDR